MTKYSALSRVILYVVVITHLTQAELTTESHAEEEEEKEETVFGNESFRATFPPDDFSTKSNFLDDKIFAIGENVLWNRGGTNVSDYDSPLEEIKQVGSPENSVDRDSLDNMNYFLQENPDIEPSAHFEFKRERPAANRSDSMLLRSISMATTESTKLDASRAIVSVSCTFGERKCNTTENDTSSLRTAEVSSVAFSSTVVLWDLVKTVVPGQVTTPIFKEAIGETVSVSDIPTTTARPVENFILVDDVETNKDDPVIHDSTTNKSEKTKAEKENQVFDELIVPCSSFKESMSTSVSNEDKVQSSTNAFGIVDSTINSPTSPDFELLVSMNSRKVGDSGTTLLAFTEKDARNGLDERLKKQGNSRATLTNFHSTETYNNDKTDPENENKIKLQTPKLPTVTLSSSLREEVTVPLSTPFIETSRSTIKLEITNSSIISQTAKTINPSLSDLNTVMYVKPSVGFASTQASPSSSTTSADADEFPIIKEVPPRLSYPSCSSLPMCIEITLLETTWEEFCNQMHEFREFLSKSASHYTRRVHPHQIIVDTARCSTSSGSRLSQTTADVTFGVYVTNESGEYEERLTEICGIVLRKWAPTAFRNSVLEVRMYNADIQSTPLPLLPEVNSGFVAAVSISAVAGVALCMLCILLVIMKQKLVQGRNSATATPTADAYSLDSLSINASFRRRRNRRSARSYLNHAFTDQEIPTHPLNEKTLANCLKSRDLLEEEFKKIPMNMPKLDTIPEGAHVKNRYSNILPKTESRVLLADPSGDPLKCYINANYIKGFDGKSAIYIACQAPLPEGVEDFWRMVWEQQSRVIVMLTMLEENGTSRCALYFPQSTLVSQQPYGDFQISLLKKDVYEFYTMSTLRILDMEKNLFRDVVHLWFTGWPDLGVPKDPSSLITFIQQCRSYIGGNAGPTIVHCSTGTGRTGVFLAVDICMREYEESRSVDILQCVARLRRDRAGAVQNKDQYILIHEAMLEYISRMGNGSLVNNKSA